MKGTVSKLLVIAMFLMIFLMFFGSNAEAARIRAFHIPLGGIEYKEYILFTINKIAGKFNTLIIEVDNKVKYDSFPEISVQNSMSKNDLREIITYAKSKGLEVIPEVKFLTHQQNLLRSSHSELMFNTVTYDSNKPEVYKITFSVIDEIIGIFHPKYFHIGHDEMREYWGKIPGQKSKLPSYRDYAFDANKLAAYLKSKGITPIMWGDMLLNPDFFAVRNKTDMNGGVQDYYKTIDILDKDIIIADWRYYAYEDTFPTIDYFLSKGFKVLGVTWKDETTIKNFSHYVCSRENPNAFGMIATTWFHFNNKETDIIDRIITISAAAFTECH